MQSESVSGGMDRPQASGTGEDQPSSHDAGHAGDQRSGEGSQSALERMRTQERAIAEGEVRRSSRPDWSFPE